MVSIFVVGLERRMMNSCRSCLKCWLVLQSKSQLTFEMLWKVTKKFNDHFDIFFIGVVYICGIMVIIKISGE